MPRFTDLPVDDSGKESTNGVTTTKAYKGYEAIVYHKLCGYNKVVQAYKIYKVSIKTFTTKREKDKTIDPENLKKAKILACVAYDIAKVLNLTYGQTKNSSNYGAPNIILSNNLKVYVNSIMDLHNAYLQDTQNEEKLNSVIRGIKALDSITQLAVNRVLKMAQINDTNDSTSSTDPAAYDLSKLEKVLYMDSPLVIDIPIAEIQERLSIKMARNEPKTKYITNKSDTIAINLGGRNMTFKFASNNDAMIASINHLIIFNPTQARVYINDLLKLENLNPEIKSKLPTLLNESMGFLKDRVKIKETLRGKIKNLLEIYSKPEQNVPLEDVRKLKAELVAAFLEVQKEADKLSSVPDTVESASHSNKNKRNINDITNKRNKNDVLSKLAAMDSWGLNSIVSPDHSVYLPSHKEAQNPVGNHTDEIYKDFEEIDNLHLDFEEVDNLHLDLEELDNLDLEDLGFDDNEIPLVEQDLFNILAKSESSNNDDDSIAPAPNRKKPRT